MAERDGGLDGQIEGTDTLLPGPVGDTHDTRYFKVVSDVTFRETIGKKQHDVKGDGKKTPELNDPADHQ